VQGTRHAFRGDAAAYIGFTLILDSRVLRDQYFNERTQQRLPSLSGIVHKLEETQIERQFFL